MMDGARPDHVLTRAASACDGGLADIVALTIEFAARAWRVATLLTRVLPAPRLPPAGRHTTHRSSLSRMAWRTADVTAHQGPASALHRRLPDVISTRRSSLSRMAWRTADVTAHQALPAPWTAAYRTSYRLIGRVSSRMAWRTAVSLLTGSCQRLDCRLPDAIPLVGEFGEDGLAHGRVTAHQAPPAPWTAACRTS